MPSSAVLYPGAHLTHLLAKSEEDDDGDYAAALLRMFVSTGLVHRQPLFLATPHRDPAALLHACPAPVAATAATAASAAAAVVPQAGDSIAEAAEEEEEEEDAQAAALSIAWRYSNLPQVEVCSMVSVPIWSHFFLTTSPFSVDTRRIGVPTRRGQPPQWSCFG